MKPFAAFKFFEEKGYKYEYVPVDAVNGLFAPDGKVLFWDYGHANYDTIVKKANNHYQKNLVKHNKNENRN